MSASFGLHTEMAVGAAINARVSIQVLLAPFYRRMLEPAGAAFIVWLFTQIATKGSIVLFCFQMYRINNKHKMMFLRLNIQLPTHFINLKVSKDQRQCVIFATLNAEYIIFRTGNVVRYLMLYAPAPSSWPMPDRLASKSWASPDSITSSVRGNFRAHAMATITKFKSSLSPVLPKSSCLYLGEGTWLVNSVITQYHLREFRQEALEWRMVNLI